MLFRSECSLAEKLNVLTESTLERKNANSDLLNAMRHDTACNIRANDLAKRKKVFQMACERKSALLLWNFLSKDGYRLSITLNCGLMFSPP